MSILIKGALLDGAVTDVYIEKKEIRQVGTDLQVQADQVIDGRRKALIPGFVNAHTHAAMTLFRGFGDDMPLMPWLEQKIWPNEAKLTREDVYWGTKLACLEMIKSGTTTFFDMYHKFRATADAVEEMGLRALLAGVCFDHFKPELAEKSKRENEKLVVDVENYSKRICGRSPCHLYRVWRTVTVDTWFCCRAFRPDSSAFGRDGRRSQKLNQTVRLYSCTLFI